MLENSLGLPLLEEFQASLIYPAGKKLSRESKQSISCGKYVQDTWNQPTKRLQELLHCLDLLLLGSAWCHLMLLGQFESFSWNSLSAACRSTTPSHCDSESWTAPRGSGEIFAPNTKTLTVALAADTPQFGQFCKWQYHPQLSRRNHANPKMHNWLQFEAVVNSSKAWRTSGTWGSQAAPASQSTLQAGSEWICTNMFFALNNVLIRINVLIISFIHIKACFCFSSKSSKRWNAKRIYAPEPQNPRLWKNAAKRSQITLATGAPTKPYTQQGQRFSSSAQGNIRNTWELPDSPDCLRLSVQGRFRHWQPFVILVYTKVIPSECLVHVSLFVKLGCNLRPPYCFLNWCAPARLDGNHLWID